MFGILDRRTDQGRTGLYFKEYPALPLKNSGVRFKYKEDTESTRMQDIVIGLANASKQTSIVTTDDVSFEIEGYVLLDRTLYRIIDIGSAIISPAQTARLLKYPKTIKTLILNRVSNSLDLEI